MNNNELTLAVMPDDVLLQVMEWLPLQDLKNMALVNRRIGALAGRAIAGRRNVYLVLSRRVRPSVVSPLEFINPGILLTTERRYCQLAIACSRNRVPVPLGPAISEIPGHWVIRSMYLNLRKPETLLKLFVIFSRGFVRLSHLTVDISMSSNQNGDVGTLFGSFPYLRELTWVDQYRSEPRNPTVRLNFFVPNLQTLKLYTCHSVQQSSMRLVDGNMAASLCNPNRRWDVSPYVHMRKLSCRLSLDVQETLFRQVLPSLEYLECIVTNEPLPELWRRLGTCVPNLRHLRIHTMLDVFTSSSLIGCHRLEWLELHGGSMSVPLGSSFLRRLCLNGCRLPPEPALLQLPALETFCLVATFQRQHDIGTVDQDWVLPSLRHLCVEASGNLGIDIRNCRRLEYCHLIVRGPMVLLPWTMPLLHLTTLQVECHWRQCHNAVAHVLVRAPNLQNLRLLLRGCAVEYLRYLPRWCPRLRTLVLQTYGNRLTISYDTLAAIFALPDIEEIILFSITVTGIDAPIAIPRQLRVLIMAVYSGPTDVPLFQTDPDDPAAGSRQIDSCKKNGRRCYTVNVLQRKSHLRSRLSANPFGCRHVVNMFNRWLIT